MCSKCKSARVVKAGVPREGLDAWFAAEGGERVPVRVAVNTPGDVARVTVTRDVAGYQRGFEFLIRCDRLTLGSIPLEKVSGSARRRARRKVRDPLTPTAPEVVRETARKGHKAARAAAVEQVVRDYATPHRESVSETYNRHLSLGVIGDGGNV